MLKDSERRTFYVPVRTGALYWRSDRTRQDQGLDVDKGEINLGARVV